MNDEVLAYFITWTCYGSWLPGDSRGWTKWHKGEQTPQPFLEDWCRKRMKEAPLRLDAAQRQIVELAIRDHCAKRQWKLVALNCRSNHCHVVVAAPDCDGELVRDQLKAWATRRLKEQQRAGGEEPDGLRRSASTAASSSLREQWWTGKGSVRRLYDDESVATAAMYTLEAQDAGGSKANSYS